jgi:hypothetical protein
MIKLSDELLHVNDLKSNEKDCSFNLPLAALTHHHIIPRAGKSCALLAPWHYNSEHPHSAFGHG